MTSLCRRGFTLLELLVAVSIILILIALLLPAVQQAREAARRASCANNLVQFGVALHNYHSAHSTLPPGSVNETGPVSNVLNSGYQIGWVVLILPQLDESNLYQEFDFRKPAGQQPFVGTPASQQIPKVFRCPSNPKTPGLDYAGCHHDIEAPIDVDNNGVLYLNSSIRLRDIVDGRSYTILAGESLNLAGLPWFTGTSASLRNTGALGDVSEAMAMWQSRNAGSGDDATPDLFVADPDVLLHVGGFASFHSGGANFVFGDGSVRFVSEHIDQRIYQCLGNRQDGEVVRF